MRSPIPGPAHCILAATDGSPAGDHAVDIARQLTGRGIGIDLAVVTVRRRGEMPAAPAGQVGRWGSTTSAVSTFEPEILIGHPSIEIAREAERRGVSLIILGRRPVGTTGTATLGPTADQIVRGASVPCLLVPLGSWRSPPRLLAAVDGTERGERVRTGAVAIAELLRGTMRSVTVVAAPRLSSCGNAGPDGARVVRSGDPVDEVLAEAQREVDLLVVGVHRLGRPDSEVERGISRRILRRSVGPVLTIPL